MNDRSPDAVTRRVGNGPGIRWWMRMPEATTFNRIDNGQAGVTTPAGRVLTLIPNMGTNLMQT